MNKIEDSRNSNLRLLPVQHFTLPVGLNRQDKQYTIECSPVELAID